jgi:HEAT repeat protein
MVMSCDRANREKTRSLKTSTAVVTEPEKAAATAAKPVANERPAMVEEERAFFVPVSRLVEKYRRVQSRSSEVLHRGGQAEDVEPLIACLKDEDWKFRLNAAAALGKIGDKRAVEPLIGCLSDERTDGDYNHVRNEAVGALVKIGQPAVEPLIAYLKCDAGRASHEADRALVAIGTPSVEPLIVCLRESDATLRSRAAEALGNIGNHTGDKRAVEPLIACLNDRELTVRHRAAVALGAIGDKRAVEPLLAHFKVGEVAEALRRLRYTPPNARTQIEFLVGLGSSAYREDWDACARHGATAVEPLIPLLKHENWRLRMNAASALGKLGDKRAAEPLIACLQTREQPEEVRREAAEALGKLGGNEAVQPLVDALPDWPISAVTAVALKRLGWKPTTVKERFYFRIGERDKKGMLEDWKQTRQLILDDAESRDTQRVQCAVSTLIALGREEMVVDLVRVLNSSDDTSVAVVYLNCGHKGLSTAAEQWAAKRGYKVTIGPDSSGAGWGSW